MSWVSIYIDINFLAPIPYISSEIIDFPSKFLPKSMNFSRSIPIQKKLACRPEKVGLFHDIRLRKNPNWLELAQDRLKLAHPPLVNAHLRVAAHHLAPHRPPTSLHLAARSATTPAHLHACPSFSPASARSSATRATSAGTAPPGPAPHRLPQCCSRVASSRQPTAQ
jgi:hypothetical protein